MRQKIRGKFVYINILLFKLYLSEIWGTLFSLYNKVTPVTSFIRVKQQYYMCMRWCICEAWYIMRCRAAKNLVTINKVSLWRRDFLLVIIMVHLISTVRVFASWKIGRSSSFFDTQILLFLSWSRCKSFLHSET